MSKLIEAAAEFLARNTLTKQITRITEAEYQMPYSSKTSDPPDVRYKNVIAHAKKMGYNVHHNEHMGDDKSGNKGSPDITFHYERGDHRNNADPASIQIHSGNASNDSTLKALAKGKSK